LACAGCGSSSALSVGSARRGAARTPAGRALLSGTGRVSAAHRGRRQRSAGTPGAPRHCIVFISACTATGTFLLRGRYEQTSSRSSAPPQPYPAFLRRHSRALVKCPSLLSTPWQHCLPHSLLRTSGGCTTGCLLGGPAGPAAAGQPAAPPACRRGRHRKSLQAPTGGCTRCWPDAGARPSPHVYACAGRRPNAFGAGSSLPWQAVSLAAAWWSGARYMLPVTVFQIALVPVGGPCRRKAACAHSVRCQSAVSQLLGNTPCGSLAARAACAPLHMWGAASLCDSAARSAAARVWCCDCVVRRVALLC